MSVNKDNIFDQQVLIETIISDLEVVKESQVENDQKIKSIQKSIANLRSDLVKSGVLKLY